MKNIENVVVVLSLDNYKAEYQEEVPFKAKLINQYDINYVVQSLATGQEYELYDHQILECFNDKQLKVLINLDKHNSDLDNIK